MVKKVTPEIEAQAETTTPERLQELATNPKLQEFVAANSAAPKSLLQHLAETGTEAVKKCCAANPNTPKETLLRLAANFPEEFVGNPVFNLLRLENPQLLQDLPQKGLQKLLAKADVEVDIVRSLAAHPDPEIAVPAKCHLHSTITINPAWESEALANRLSNIKGGRAKYKEYKNEILVLIWNGTAAENIQFLPVEMRARVAENPNCPLELLQQLAHDKNELVRAKVAENPNCPPALLQKFAHDDKFVRTGVAKNPNCSPALLQQLASDENENVRAEVAQNQNCPPALLQQLAHDDDLRDAQEW
ncbi:variant leucine-rich repeat-containing protein, partial [Picosynechococcus sp. NKBG042902]